MSAVTILHAGPLLTFGRFRLLADHPRWAAEDCIGPGHHLAFPGRVVGIGHDRAPARPVDATMVVYYNPGQRYRRVVLDADGDRCAFVIPGRALLAELTGTDGDLRWRHPVGPAGPAAFVVGRVLAAALAEPGRVDALAVEERLAWAVADCLWRAGHGPRSAPRTAADEAVEAVRVRLATRPGERLSLAGLAAAVGVSPFHLARRFRARTGLSVHGYRHQLRVRRAVERICESDTELAPLALELGFASHSHLTDSVRATLGVPPSALRWRAPGELTAVLRRLAAA